MTEVFEVFRSELQAYADRGIFQNLSCNIIGENISEFKFHWMTDKQFTLRLNVIKHELELRDILPSVSFRSDMDNAFRGFILSRCTKEIPIHRRLDGERLNIKAKNKNGNVSVLIGFSESDSCLAVKTSINLLHEIFNNFLMEGPYQNYMVEVFNLPEE